MNILKDRLSKLYSAARDNYYTRKDGTRVPKFVNLDIEEYRNLDITAAAFTRTLDEEEFKEKAGCFSGRCNRQEKYHHHNRHV